MEIISFFNQFKKRCYSDIGIMNRANTKRHDIDIHSNYSPSQELLKIHKKYIQYP